MGLLLYWAIPKSESIYFGFIIVLLFVIGAWSATQVEKETATTDNRIIVIDEIVGMLITLVFFKKKLIWLAIGFFLFRLFDITKPPPANYAEKLPAGWGVMMDDVVAGLYSAISLRMIYVVVNELV